MEQAHPHHISLLASHGRPCRRAGGTLDEGLRERVYCLFVQYERLKGQQYAWDMCDLVAHLHRQLAVRGLPAAAKFHFIYIDEVGREGGRKGREDGGGGLLRCLQPRHRDPCCLELQDLRIRGSLMCTCFCLPAPAQLQLSSLL